ncbi:MAG: translation initiation factor IF-2, partial [Candidatus Thioglobus sp.]|nr:translation initiation factor IF-2 [Candidatus Thioglobus sp.]
MAHTVESLSKLLKRTPDQVISILTAAGIQGKNADSDISADERQVLMSSLSKRSGTKLNISVPRKTPKTNTTSSSTGGVKIKVKKKREEPIVSTPDAVNEEIASKAREALEAGRLAEQKDQEHDAKRHEVVRQQKIKTEELKAQDIQNKVSKKDELANKDSEKVEVEKPKEGKKQPKRLRAASTPSSRQKQLHVAKHNPNRKLKKKERTQISQKVQDEQAQHGFHKPVEPITREVYIPETIKISELALKMTTKAGEVLKVMMGMGVMATLNDVIDQDTAMLVVEEMGHTPLASNEETVEDTLVQEVSDNSESSPRPPVVTIMGHVDHGKTSLLDYIRKSKVASAEVGGITQHIGAYQVSHKDNLITFIDTPGHAAFSKMRLRGASATDIVILVVAADDGVMPQTIESIKHAKASGVPIIVAINKIDKEGVAIDKVKQVLSTHDVISEEWGGDVMMVGVSAHTGEGIDELLEGISLTAEMYEVSAVVDKPASGVVLEARLDKGRGKVTTILVQSGTLKKGDIVIAGLEYGKIKQIINDNGKPINVAGPSTPVEILGLSGVPDSGAEVLVVESERKAREVADFRKSKDRETKLQKQQAEKMDNFFS